jgi:hypothetical protein
MSSSAKNKGGLDMFKDIGQGIVIIIGLMALGVLGVWELFEEITGLIRGKSKHGC